MFTSLKSIAAGAAFAALAIITGASAQNVVFSSGDDLGSFTPFNASNAAVVTYGDSGWLGPGPGAPGVGLSSIKLRLATWGSNVPGSTDIEFTLNDGDPSRLVFGTGDVLYSTTIEGVKLPPAQPGVATFFEIDIPLPGVRTRGGFNNVGWSIKCRNFNYAGQFGFQVSSCTTQYLGFYTNNASFFNGNGWSLFAFGPNSCTQIAQFSVTIFDAPPCVGDINSDGAVDSADLGSVLSAWGSVGKSIPEDLNGDFQVDSGDLGVLLSAWGACP
jgi:hypothetical protein